MIARTLLNTHGGLYIKVGPMCYTSWVWHSCLFQCYIWEDKSNAWKITREIRQKSNKSHGSWLGKFGEKWDR